MDDSFYQSLIEILRGEISIEEAELSAADLELLRVWSQHWDKLPVELASSDEESDAA